MRVRHRPMERDDVRLCAEIVVTDPFVGPRYESAIDLIVSSWQALLTLEAFRANVFEELDGARTRLLGSAVAVFASDAFVADLKTPPLSWIGPELARRVATGKSPLLSDREVREANANAGLNVVVCESCLRQECAEYPEVVNEVFVAFYEEYRGFRVKEMIAQGTVPEAVRTSLNAGALVWDGAGYVRATEAMASAIFASPHVLGLTRELALDHRGSQGSRLSWLFLHQPPRLDLRPSEQRLLLLACRGGTDEELAARRGVSLSAVKKIWRLVYARVAERAPEVGLDLGTADSRGPDKKQRLLSYLREHPEELRPIARRSVAAGPGRTDAIS